MPSLTTGSTSSPLLSQRAPFTLLGNRLDCWPLPSVSSFGASSAPEASLKPQSQPRGTLGGILNKFFHNCRLSSSLEGKGIWRVGCQCGHSWGENSKKDHKRKYSFLLLPRLNSICKLGKFFHLACLTVIVHWFTNEGAGYTVIAHCFINKGAEWRFAWRCLSVTHPDTSRIGRGTTSLNSNWNVLARVGQDGTPGTTFLAVYMNFRKPFLSPPFPIFIPPHHLPAVFCPFCALVHLLSQQLSTSLYSIPYIL